jgi:hypothetical protein
MQTQKNLVNRMAAGFNPAGWNYGLLGGMAVLCGLLLCSGCARKKAEPRITGKKSAPPVSLQCAWKPGLRYIVRMETEQLTDDDMTDGSDSGQHRVAFAQECQIDVTESRKEGSLQADVTVLSLAMERSKGNQIVVSFDSEPGWEPVTEEDHYTAIMRELVGGRMKFLVAPDGKVLNSQGLPQWLNKGFNSDPRVAAAGKKNPGTITVTNVVNGVTNVTRKALNNPNMGGRDKRSSVVNSLRNFFTPDHFRQMFEFSHLPAQPVRVGETWNAQGPTSMSGRSTSRYNTTDEFVGWQLNSNTNCARININGEFMPNGLTMPSNKRGTFKGTVWVNTDLGFPMTQGFYKQGFFPDSATSKQIGTNNVASATGNYKSVSQTVSITLIEVAPLETNTKTAAAGSN